MRGVTQFRGAAGKGLGRQLFAAEDIEQDEAHVVAAHGRPLDPADDQVVHRHQAPVPEVHLFGRMGGGRHVPAGHGSKAPGPGQIRGDDGGHVFGRFAPAPRFCKGDDGDGLGPFGATGDLDGESGVGPGLPDQEQQQGDNGQWFHRFGPHRQSDCTREVAKPGYHGTLFSRAAREIASHDGSYRWEWNREGAKDDGTAEAWRTEGKGK